MNQLETQMKSLRLAGMAQSWGAMVETRRHHELSLAEGLEILLQAEEQQRSNNRTDRLRKGARFRYRVSPEELLYGSTRGLDKAQVTHLVMGDYIDKGECVLITGATGCGKSFLASALGHHACSQGHKVAYYNLQKLLIKTKMSRR